ncbi:hypothetical protein [Cytobacillus firmus]|nr:hypothetical protein [Cytobacillus firmus]
MEKTIPIDGKKVKFKSAGGNALRYKMQFGRDFIVDIAKMNELTKLQIKVQKGKRQPTYEEIKSLDTEVFFNIAWVLAKTADDSIPEPLTWLDSFEAFPLMEILPELGPLIAASMETSKKK